MSRIITPGHPEFYINRRNYAETEACAVFGVEGFFTGQAIKPGVGVTREFGVRVPVPNLITNIGMNAIGGQYGLTQFSRMHLGTGTTPPTNTDSALTNFGVSVLNADPVEAYSIQASAPYYCQINRTWLSAVGGATGNWTEIGVSSQNTTGNLRSKALILDGGGAPTVFPVLADEQFQGTYSFRIYMPTADEVRSITLSGTPYTATSRAAQVTTLNATSNGWYPHPSFPLFNGRPDGNNCYTGALAAITSQPSGALSGFASQTTAAYTTDSFTSNVSYRWGSGQAVGTVRTVLVHTVCSCFQIEYSPTFAKLSTQEFIHNQRYTWARR